MCAQELGDLLWPGLLRGFALGEIYRNMIEEFKAEWHVGDST